MMPGRRTIKRPNHSLPAETGVRNAAAWCWTSHSAIAGVLLSLNFIGVSLGDMPILLPLNLVTRSTHTAAKPCPAWNVSMCGCVGTY